MTFGQSWRTLLKSFKMSYEHLGKLALLNLVWFTVGVGPLMIGAYLPWESPLVLFVAGMLSLITLGGAFPALHSMTNRIIDGEVINWRQFLPAFKKYVVRGTILLALRLFGFFVLTFNIWVALNKPSTLYLILSGFWLWGIVYWYAMQQYVYPLLTRHDLGVLTVLKRAALLTLDNPLASVFVFVISVVINVLSVILTVPLTIFTAGFLAFLQNNFLLGLLEKYSEPEEKVVESGEQQQEGGE
ncbi:MAG: hypothetical protein QM392_05395 [Bacillota bacterium]|nr:hypothetical protein [Bacillota bacterium]